MLLRAANGSPIQALGSVTLRVTSGDVSRSVDALVIPSLGPDQILLDNATIANSGAILVWKRQRPNFLSSKTSIPAVHRLASKSIDSAPSCVAAVHSDAMEHDVLLTERIDLKAHHMVVVTAYTNTKPYVDTAVVVEPWLPSEPELSCSNPQPVFEKIMVVSAVATWCTSDGAVQVQVANPSSEHVALPAGLKLGSLSPVNITTVKRAPINGTSYVSSVAASPQTSTDRATAKAELMEQLASAFINSTFSAGQKNEVMDLCARFRQVFSCSSEE